MNTTVPVYRLQQVVVDFGNAPVLQVPDLAIPSSVWVSVVGPNGAGKSTLLKVLAGLLPTTGTVNLMHQPLAQWHSKERARALAWLGQGEAVAEDLRVYDIVMLGRLPHQPWLAAPSAKDHAIVEQVMHQTHIWALRERGTRQLSGGEYQRVLLARALAVQAQVLLLDEPLMHLDPPHQADWIALMQALVTAGTTVVSVLHEISIALHADHVLVMQQGRVVHQGTPCDTITHSALEQVFENRLTIHPLAHGWAAMPRVAAKSY